jgi:glycosyltransferase involved in cell wall biosynthesis
MQGKKISVITVNYNNKVGLEKTINSVVKQTYKNFEYIVIDGDSNDGSKQLITTYNDKLAHAVSEADNGIYHAMNKGIEIATGDYILFLNSGDCLFDENVLSQVAEAMTDGLDIYYGDIIYDEIHQQHKRTFPEKLTFAFFYEQNLSHQASFIRSSLFTDIFYYNEDFKIVSDWEFFTYAICKREASYKHLDFVVTIYDATGISSNQDNHPMMYKEREASLNRYFPEYVSDYDYLKTLKFKKLDQFLFIKQHTIAYKILKACINIILLFLPKFKRTK